MKGATKKLVDEVEESHKSSVLDIDISDIVINVRKREVIEARVAVIMESVKALGLLQPIVINPEYVLIAGRNRIEACKNLGWKTIPATIKSYDEIDAELAEIDENLARAELSGMERSIQYPRRQELYKQKKYISSVEVDEENPGFRDESGEYFGDETTFVKDTAAKTGRGKSQIRSELRLGRELLENLTPEVRKLLAPTKMADNKTQLRLLIAEPDADVRLEIAKRINDDFVRNGEKAKVTIDEVQKALRGETTFESTVSDNGASTLERALRSSVRILDMSVNTTKFRETAELWTVEGLIDIREELLQINNLTQQGIDVLSEIIDSKTT